VPNAHVYAGIDVRWRLHDLRHWLATEAIGRGHDIRTVAGRLGHANPAMTLRTDAHALDGTDAGVAATLASALEDEDAKS
jgi:integrase